MAIDVEVANPQHPHIATILLLDISSSMIEGNKISMLNEGLKVFKQTILNDELASKRVDLSIITFGDGVEVSHGFSSIDEFDPVNLEANGYTPMGEAILLATTNLEERVRMYKEEGISKYVPWIFMLTDGMPTDMNIGDELWNKVVDKVRNGDNKKKFLFFTVGVGDADMELLRELAPEKRQPVKLNEKKFKEMFEWISRSQIKVSASKPGEQVPLDNITGWAEI